MGSRCSRRADTKMKRTKFYMFVSALVRLPLYFIELVGKAMRAELLRRMPGFGAWHMRFCQLATLGPTACLDCIDLEKEASDS